MSIVKRAANYCHDWGISPQKAGGGVCLVLLVALLAFRMRPWKAVVGAGLLGFAAYRLVGSRPQSPRQQMGRLSELSAVEVVNRVGGDRGRSLLRSRQWTDPTMVRRAQLSIVFRGPWQSAPLGSLRYLPEGSRPPGMRFIWVGEDGPCMRLYDDLGTGFRERKFAVGPEESRVPGNPEHKGLSVRIFQCGEEFVSIPKGSALYRRIRLSRQHKSDLFDYKKKGSRVVALGDHQISYQDPPNAAIYHCWEGRRMTVQLDEGGEGRFVAALGIPFRLHLFGKAIAGCGYNLELPGVRPSGMVCPTGFWELTKGAWWLVSAKQILIPYVGVNQNRGIEYDRSFIGIWHRDERGALMGFEDSRDEPRPRVVEKLQVGLPVAHLRLEGDLLFAARVDFCDNWSPLPGDPVVFVWHFPNRQRLHRIEFRRLFFEQVHTSFRGWGISGNWIAAWSETTIVWKQLEVEASS